MKRNCLSVMLLLIICLPLEAKEEKWKQVVRPYVKKYLGEEIEVKLLGKVRKVLELPSLPEIKSNAK